MIRPYAPDDDENPYAQAGAGSHAPADDPNAAPADAPPSAPPAPASPSPVKPYTPPDATAASTSPKATTSASDSGTPDTPPARTFAQMEADGEARPPAPEPSAPPGSVPAPVADPSTPSPFPGLTPITSSVPPVLKGPEIADETGFTGTNGTTPITSSVPTAGDPNSPIQPFTSPDPTPILKAAPMADETGMTTSGTPLTEDPGQPPVTIPDAPVTRVGTPPLTEGIDLAPPGGTPVPPSSVDSILPLLTGKAAGTASTPLQDATTKATLSALTDPNPYNADEVKREYADLGAGIDADYDSRQRGLTNSFAQRGLYGSLGKDFASGRASDTEVGRRSAKEQLASDLATKQAQSAATARSQAIAQGQAGTNATDANQRAWLQSLMGYGNDAFNHDLSTAQFQQGQNESEQDYYLRLLQAGYGV